MADVNIVNVAFERDIVAKALQDFDFADKLCAILGQQYLFNLPHNNFIYDLIYKRWKDGTTLSKKVFREQLESTRKLSEAKKQIYYEEFTKLQEKKNISDADYGFQKIKSYFDLLTVKKAVDKLRDNLDRGDDFYEQIAKFKSQIMNIGVNSDAMDFEYTGNWEQRFQARHERKTKIKSKYISDDEFIIPTGITQLDFHLGGGLEAGKAASVLGKASSGKSMFLINLFYHAMINNYNVIIFTFEDAKELINTRLDARTTGFPYMKIKNNELTPEEERVAKHILDDIYDRTDNVVKIIECNNDETVEEMSNIVKELERKYKICFHLFGVDYLDIAGYRGHLKEERLKQKEVYQQFKNHAKIERKANWTATQAGKTAGTVPTIEDVSEAYAKAKILDVIFGIGDNQELRENNQMRGFLGKNREGDSRISIDLSTDKSISLITDFANE